MVKTITKSIIALIRRLSTISIIMVTFFLNDNPLFAQQKNGIDEKRKTIANVRDTLVKLSDRLYAIISSGEAGNIAVYENPDGLILVDDQRVELTPKVKALLLTVSSKPVKYIINTHFHYDHSDGNKVFGKEGVVIISHDNIRKRLEETQILSITNLVQQPYPFEALPVITFSDSLTLHEPNEQIKVFHVKNAHTDGDSFIAFMDANVVHTGDVFVRYGFPFIDENSGGNIYGMINAINMLISSVNDSTKIIPGHGSISQKKDLISYRDMLVTVESRVRYGIEHNLSIEEIRKQNPLRDMKFQVDYYFSLEMIYNMVKKKMNK